ncbi:mechanosensitive ion channel family protein [Lentisalinibacter orientalis]|uniref:mechanosensitive ion channel family protein n=1 Tax=Lentisalinibacter orientalis TaxID=2992241 RepID=UPI003869456A
MEEYLAQATEYGQLALGYLQQTGVVFQAALIAGLFALAWGLTWWAKPRLEERARGIKGYPGVLRLIVLLLRRLLWIFFVLFLGTADVLVRSIGWPENDILLSNVLLLSLAWLVISFGSQVIRSRAIGRTFAVLGWVYVAATVLGITDDIAAVLGGIGFQIGTGGARLTLLVAIKAVLLLGVLLWAATALGNFLDQRIQRSDELTPSLRVLIGKVLRITLVVVAALVALGGLGIDLTVFTVLSGAIGVGIGFGLQKVVSNFISGIIILLDRSIKPGDTISLGETFGWIRELRARFVSVVTRDGREYLIPNEDFITREVINWSFSDDLVRIDVPFGVSYSSDPHQVIELAIEAAASVKRVESSQKPVCWMTEFGDSSLNFLVRFWIRDPQNGLTNIRGQVLLALWDSFKEHGINIPFPHREVIMRTPVEVARVPEGD